MEKETVLFPNGKRYNTATADPRTLFVALHKVWSVNPFTPTILEYEKAGPYVWEMSKGTDMEGQKVYALSVWNYETQEKQPELGGLFWSHEKLHQRVLELRMNGHGTIHRVP